MTLAKHIILKNFTIILNSLQCPYCTYTAADSFHNPIELDELTSSRPTETVGRAKCWTLSTTLQWNCSSICQSRLNTRNLYKTMHFYTLQLPGERCKHQERKKSVYNWDKSCTFILITTDSCYYFYIFMRNS